jgi:multisubunit Na+/H+ antiporter MnhB subunit
VLASNGIVGLVVFTVAFIILPLSYLYKIRGESNQPERLSGIVLIVAVMIFGLTETWILRAPFIAIFAIYLVALFVPAGKKLRNDEYQ